MRREWIRSSKWNEREAAGRAKLLSENDKLVKPESNFSGRPWACPIWLPLPDVERLDKLEEEMERRPREASLGPLASEYRDEVLDWAWGLRVRYRGTSLRVTGSWRKNKLHWRKLLSVLPKKKRKRPLSIVEDRVGLPWNEMPPGPIRCKKTGGCPRNHKDLWMEKDEFWLTLEQQLMEGAVIAWDCEGRSDNDVLPRGMFPVRWVIKAGTGKVRITINMMSLNDWLNTLYCSVELPSVRNSRFMHRRWDWKSGLNMHSSYFHPEYKEEEYTWVGFSVCDDELPEDAVEFLWEHFAHCRWRNRWVFCYASFAMGCSSSVSDFQCVTSAAVESMERSGVGKAYGLRLRQWQGQVFIDDTNNTSGGGPTLGLRNGSGFGNALELSLRTLATFIWLGTDVNVDKSQIIPRRGDSIFLGIGHDTRLLRFFLAMKRCEKMRSAVTRLRSRVRVGHRVEAKEVARLIGALWSVMVVCFRAVAMMTRGMIRTLAVMLGDPQVLLAPTISALKWILKRLWRGTVLWTWEADCDLTFWEVVPWELLWSPMGYDVFVEALIRAVSVAAPDELADDVTVFASDASDIAIGGGVFNPEGDGSYSRVSTSHHMLEQPDGSSSLRELEGSIKTALTDSPPVGTRMLGVMDSLTVSRILRKGSGVEELHNLSRWFFLWCLRRATPYHPVWQSRNSQIISTCDSDSRIVDQCNYSAHPGLFWEANAVAVRLWGQGFSYDRFAAVNQVQPVDCAWKLPFSARFRQACASGVDAFADDWTRDVNWVNAPFGLLGRVLNLLRSQRAVAAVVVPGVSKKWWSRLYTWQSEGVVHRMRFDPRDPRCRPVNSPTPTPWTASGLAVVFVDFRRRQDRGTLRGGWTAEDIQRAWKDAGCPTCPLFARVDGTLVPVPSVSPHVNTMSPHR